MTVPPTDSAAIFEGQRSMPAERTAASEQTLVFLSEARARLVEAVVAGRLDAGRARAIFAGLNAHAEDIVAGCGPPLAA